MPTSHDYCRNVNSGLLPRRCSFHPLVYIMKYTDKPALNTWLALDLGAHEFSEDVECDTSRLIGPLNHQVAKWVDSSINPTPDPNNLPYPDGNHHLGQLSYSTDGTLWNCTYSGHASAPGTISCHDSQHPCENDERPDGKVYMSRDSINGLYHKKWRPKVKCAY